MEHGVLITDENPALAAFALSWQSPIFSVENGLGPMASLHEAGSALVAVAYLDDHGLTVLGSGAMVAPGLLVTATHVLDEVAHQGHSPLFLTFLPDGARACLPVDSATVSRPSAYYAQRKIVSDISVVSCTLNSQAQPEQPLMLAPLQVALPLIGERLWVCGFRHQGIDAGAALVTPLVSSGCVSAAYPTGRGERMMSACIEVDMDTIGGMSGGPVFNANGNVVGILSSSFDGGPSYVTLIWEALRMRVRGAIPTLESSTTISLLGARGRGLAKLTGNVRRNPWNDITVTLSADETVLLMRSAPTFPKSAKTRAFGREESEKFLDEWGVELETIASDHAIAELSRMPLSRAKTFMSAADIPEDCLQAIQDFSVDHCSDVEDLELLSTETLSNGDVRIEFSFEVQTLVWTVAVPSAKYRELAERFETHFFHSDENDGIVSMDLFHGCYFKGEATFNQEQQFLSDVSITSCAISPPRRRAFSSRGLPS